MIFMMMMMMITLIRVGLAAKQLNIKQLSKWKIEISLTKKALVT